MTLMGSSSDVSPEGDQEYESTPILIRTGRLIVLNWQTDDQDVVSFFKDRPDEDRLGAFDRAVRIDVIASNVAGTTERIDFIQKEFSQLQGKFGELLDSTLKQLEGKFENIFGDRGQFAKVIEDTFGDKGKLVREIFDPSKEGTPFNQLRVDFEKKLGELRTEVIVNRGIERVEKRTPIGGLRFEDEIERVLSSIVKQRKGDRLERCTTAPGKVSRSKKGDFIVRVAESPETPIVIETKDVERISLLEAQRTLEEAIRNRGAAYGILVSRDVSSLPPSVGWFNEYGNQLVCAVGDSTSDQLRHEILNIAITWARIRVVLQRVKKTSLDSPRIEEAVQKAQVAVRRLSEILTQCTNLENVSRAIRKICGEIDVEVMNQFGVISASLSAP
jgi:hypothetical protein